MPTTIWQMTRDQLVTAALQKIGVLSEGEVANPDQVADAVVSLNAVVSSLLALGMTLWTRKQLTIPLVAGKNTYLIGEGQEIDAPKPMHVVQATYAQDGNSSVYEIDIESRTNFNNRPLNAQGAPVSCTYQPLVNYGELKIWPTPNVDLGDFFLTYIAPMEAVTSGDDGSSEVLDFPREWQQALIYQLAAALADDYQLPIQDRQWLERRADRFLVTAIETGTEDASMFVYPMRS